MAQRHGMLEQGQLFTSYAALAIGVLGMSAGGPFFAMMPSVPPFLRAVWRLWATALMQLPGFCITIFQLLQERKRKKAADPTYNPTDENNPDVLAQWFRHAGLLVAAGCILGLHFISWSWSISHTSLTHSLLLVCSHPVIMVLILWLVNGYMRLLDKIFPLFAEIVERAWPGWKNRYPAGVLDTLGAFVAVAGVVLMLGGVLFGNSSSNDDDEQAVTVQGDLAALLGAVMMAGYLWAGRTVRPWMPIWLYAFPVTVSAALYSMFFSGVADSPSFEGQKEDGFFGWVYSSRLAGLTLGAAGISGILGHTLANYSLKHVPSLVVSVSILLETVVGSVIGNLAGVNENPDMWTWIGGAVLLVGGIMTIYGQEQYSRKRTMSQQRLAENPDPPTGNDFVVELSGGPDPHSASGANAN